jgi:hypothetical protein
MKVVGEAASRVGMQVYHTGQGQGERAHPRPRPLLRGLDSAWLVIGNPHRESGTRWRAAADVGERAEGAVHARQKGRAGNRVGDSVGAQDIGTREESRSAVRSRRAVAGKRSLELGRLPAVGQLSGFKRLALLARLIHPPAIHNAHPDVCQSAQSHAVGVALRQFALVVGGCPGFRERRLPGKLIEMIAPGLHTGKTLVCSGVIATLEWHWSGPSEFLDAVGIRIACAIITHSASKRGARRLPARGRELQIA